MEYDLFKRIDFKILSNLICGNENNQEIPNILSILSDEYERSTKFNKNITYDTFFYGLCPNLNFKNIEKLTYEYVKRIEREMKQFEIIKNVISN